MKSAAALLRAVGSEWDNVNRKVQESVTGVTLIDQVYDDLMDVLKQQWKALVADVKRYMAEIGLAGNSLLVEGIKSVRAWLDNYVEGIVAWIEVVSLGVNKVLEMKRKLDSSFKLAMNNGFEDWDEELRAKEKGPWTVDPAEYGSIYQKTRAIVTDDLSLTKYIGPTGAFRLMTDWGKVTKTVAEEFVYLASAAKAGQADVAGLAKALAELEEREKGNAWYDEGEGFYEWLDGYKERQIEIKNHLIDNDALVQSFGDSSVDAMENAAQGTEAFYHQLGFLKDEFMSFNDYWNKTAQALMLSQIKDPDLKAFAKIELEVDKYVEKMGLVGEAAQKVRAELIEMKKQTYLNNKANKETAKTVSEVTKEQKEAAKALERNTEAYRKLNKAIESVSWDAYISSLKGTDRVYAEIARDVDKRKKAMIEEGTYTRTNARLLEQYRQVQIKAAWATGKMTKALIEEAQAGDDFQRGFLAGIVDLQDSLTTLGSIGYETAQDLRTALGESLAAGLKGDWEGLVDVWDSFFNDLIDRAAQWAVDEMFDLGMTAVKSMFEGMMTGSSGSESWLMSLGSSIGEFLGFGGGEAKAGELQVTMPSLGMGCLPLCTEGIGAEIGKVLSGGEIPLAVESVDINEWLSNASTGGALSGLSSALIDSISADLDQIMLDPDLFAFDAAGTTGWWSEMTSGISEFWTDLKSGFTELVGGAENLAAIGSSLGALAGGYGLYSGIDAMLNGNFVGGGIEAGLGAYGLYSGIDGIMASGALTSAVSTGVASGLGELASMTGGLEAFYGSSLTAGAATTSAGIEGMLGSVSAAAPWVAAAAAAALGVGALTGMFENNPLEFRDYQTGLGDWSAVLHEEGQGALFDAQVALGQQANDSINDLTELTVGIENFRKGIDVLTNQFDSGFAEMYRSLEDGSLSVEQFADTVSSALGSGLDVTAEQAQQMETLAKQALDGSHSAMIQLQDQFKALGLSAYDASMAAMALVSAEEALNSGYRTSTEGVEEVRKAADALVDSLAGVDSSMDNSIAMYRIAQDVVSGNTGAMSDLIGKFKALGLSQEQAASAANAMTSAVRNFSAQDIDLQATARLNVEVEGDARASASVSGGSYSTSSWFSRNYGGGVLGRFADHAVGGILTDPTWIGPWDRAGEAGPEAIIPLPYGPNMLADIYDAVVQGQKSASPESTQHPVVLDNHIVIELDGERLDARIIDVNDKRSTDRQYRSTVRL